MPLASWGEMAGAVIVIALVILIARRHPKVPRE